MSEPKGNRAGTTNRTKPLGIHGLPQTILSKRVGGGGGGVGGCWGGGGGGGGCGLWVGGGVWCCGCCVWGGARGGCVSCFGGGVLVGGFGSPPLSSSRPAAAPMKEKPEESRKRVKKHLFGRRNLKAGGPYMSPGRRGGWQKEMRTKRRFLGSRERHEQRKDPVNTQCIGKAKLANNILAVILLSGHSRYFCIPAQNFWQRQERRRSMKDLRL